MSGSLQWHFAVMGRTVKLKMALPLDVNSIYTVVDIVLKY